MKRILTALVLIPIVVYVVLGANFWVFLAVLTAVSCLCYREYNDIAAGYGFGAPGVLGYGLGLVLLVWQGQSWLLIVGAALLAFTLTMRLEDLSKALPRSALLVTGIVYVFADQDIKKSIESRPWEWDVILRHSDKVFQNTTVTIYKRNADAATQ